MKITVLTAVFLLVECFLGNSFPGSLKSNMEPALGVTKRYHINDEGEIIDASRQSALDQVLDELGQTCSKSLDVLAKLFGVVREKPDYCTAILQDSPTKQAYLESFYPDPESMYCPELGDETGACQKKYVDAFQKGFLCYQQ